MADPNTAPLAVAMTATLDVAPDETRLHRFLILGTADGTYWKRGTRPHRRHRTDRRRVGAPAHP